ncbi:MAG TPA: hypothetical protein VGS16_10085 [Candidatus Dormibacteraeota bacterium]|nr:hypothetical protein [Candidatus Dormibacteraeota bacterium]
MAWGLALLATAGVIGWRRPRVDGVAVVVMLIATAVALAYVYKSLGG